MNSPRPLSLALFCKHNRVSHSGGAAANLRRAPQVGNFCKHLNVLSTSFDQSTLWTNEHVPATGTPAVQPVTPGGIFSGASVAGVEGGTFAFASRKAE